MKKYLESEQDEVTRQQLIKKDEAFGTNLVKMDELLQNEREYVDILKSDGAGSSAKEIADAE